MYVREEDNLNSSSMKVMTKKNAVEKKIVLKGLKLVLLNFHLQEEKV